LKYWTYRRRFAVEGREVETRMEVSLSELRSTLRLDGEPVAHDRTPVAGPEAVRNHHLAADLPGGERLEIEAGYVNWVDVGFAARLDGALVYESHPGKTIAFPGKLRGITQGAVDPAEKWKRNWPSLAVDLALGLVFFAVAKLFGLTEAALVGAAAGLALLVVQRFVKVDLVGGLALFGVVTLLLSAGYAWLVQDEELIKLRTTVVGLIAASMFMIDGALGGRWLGRGLGRYLPYDDLRLGRLSLGLGALGATMAVLNFAVARTLPTDVWLFYTTFGDVLIGMVLFFAVLRFARPKPAYAPLAAP
jgi:intracellular septation protein A